MLYCLYYIVNTPTNLISKCFLNDFEYHAISYEQLRAAGIRAEYRGPVDVKGSDEPMVMYIVQFMIGLSSRELLGTVLLTELLGTVLLTLLCC